MAGQIIKEIRPVVEFSRRYQGSRPISSFRPVYVWRCISVILFPLTFLEPFHYRHPSPLLHMLPYGKMDRSSETQLLCILCEFVLYSWRTCGPHSLAFNCVMEAFPSCNASLTWSWRLNFTVCRGLEWVEPYLHPRDLNSSFHTLSSIPCHHPPKEAQSSWIWRQYVPLNCLNIYPLHSAHNHKIIICLTSSVKSVNICIILSSIDTLIGLTKRFFPQLLKIRPFVFWCECLPQKTSENMSHRTLLLMFTTENLWEYVTQNTSVNVYHRKPLRICHTEHFC